MEPLTAEKKYFLAKGAEVQKPAKLSEAELKEKPKTPAWKIQVPAVLQYLQSCFDKSSDNSAELLPAMTEQKAPTISMGGGKCCEVNEVANKKPAKRVMGTFIKA